MSDAPTLDEWEQAEREYDAATDLFGYSPRPHRVCPGCGLLSEPWGGFRGAFCWLCCHNGQMDKIAKHTDAIAIRQFAEPGNH